MTLNTAILAIVYGGGLVFLGSIALCLIFMTIEGWTAMVRYADRLRQVEDRITYLENHRNDT